MSEYMEFLKTKMVIAPESGFDIDPAEIHPALKPHQRDAERDVPTLLDLLDMGIA